MNDKTDDFNQAEADEEILTYDVSDEALEASGHGGPCDHGLVLAWFPGGAGVC